MALDLDQAVVVALGSNLAGDYGSSEALLEAALARFPEAGLKILRRSGWWRSAAWPDPNGPEYRNGVALVEADGGPQAVLQTLLAIERRFGRVRGAPNEARTLDLDLIAHGRTKLDQPGLVLPHPRAHERRFVMGPLAEIAPGWVHPAVGATAAELAMKATVGSDATPGAVGRAALTWDRAAEIARELPAVEGGTYHGYPALRVAGRFLVRLGDDGASLEFKSLDPAEREMLLAADPEVFFVPRGFRGAGVFARLATLNEPTLRALLGRRWRRIAPRALRRPFETGG